MNYLDYCIDRNASICEAMKRLDILVPKVLFITEEDRLLGTLTDGDIRRFLLHRGKLEDLTEQAANHTPHCAQSRREAAELYQKSKLLAIPIVGENRSIRGIYIGEEREEQTAPKLVIPVVINAGGRGSRLEPYTKVLP